MSPAQQYILDAVGCIVVPSVINPALVEEMNAAIDAHLEKAAPIKFNFLHLSPVFLDVLVNPLVIESCKQLLGATFRFDHAFGRQQPTDFGQTGNLHGGPWSAGGALRYQREGDQVTCGQLAFGYALNSQGGAKGGFTYLPGSHKSGFPLEGKDVLTTMLNNDLDHPALICPILEAGDLVIFFESLVHGASLWKAPGFRRNLYFMYAPGYSAWRDYATVRDSYEMLARNDLERRLMRGPYVGDFDDRTGPVNGRNIKREPTC